MSEVHGIVYAYHSSPRLGDLTRYRTNASLPFCGRYRLIDFALSSLSNAGVHSVGVIMQRDYQSLLDHLGSGLGLAIVDKRREKANCSEVMNIIGNVEGKTCLLLDDMVDTAGSLCGAAKAIVEVGGAKEVYACASHGVLSGPAIDRINDSVIDELLLLDTIPYPKNKPACDKIQYLPVAPMFAEAINRIYEEMSISSLFE